MDWLTVLGILAFAVGLLLSIALHEIGHLVPAKLFGVKVSQYMVGFGRTVWSRHRGRPSTGSKPFRWAVTCAWSACSRRSPVTTLGTCVGRAPGRSRP